MKTFKIFFKNGESTKVNAESKETAKKKFSKGSIYNDMWKKSEEDIKEIIEINEKGFRVSK